jgi:hypothetical protein
MKSDFSIFDNPQYKLRKSQAEQDFLSNSNDSKMNTIEKALADKAEMEANIAKTIFEYQRNYPGLRVESISIITTIVNGHPPIQKIESKINIG